MKISHNQKGNTILIAIIISSFVIAGSIFLVQSRTANFTNTKNIKDATQSYYNLESQIEDLFYKYHTGKIIGEKTSSGDSSCDIENINHEDTWCILRKSPSSQEHTLIIETKEKNTTHLIKIDLEFPYKREKVF